MNNDFSYARSVNFGPMRVHKFSVTQTFSPADNFSNEKKFYAIPIYVMGYE